MYLTNTLLILFSLAELGLEKPQPRNGKTPVQRLTKIGPERKPWTTCRNC